MARYSASMSPPRSTVQPWIYAALCLAVALPIYSFFPVTPKPETVSDMFNFSRLTEFALLFASAYLLTNIAIVGQYRFDMRGHGLVVCVLYIAWALCSTLWSVNPVYTFGKSFEFFLLAYIAALTIVDYRNLPRLPRHGIEALITWAGLIVIVLSLISNAVLWDTPFHFHQNEGRTRFSFGYSHPLETADFCAVIAIAAFTSTLPWLLRTGVAAGATSIVYLADARSTLIFLLVVLGIGAIMRIPIAGLRLAAMAVAGLACYAAAILFLGGQFSFLPQDFGTLNGRTVLWQQSLEVAYAHLFLGVGFFATGEYLVSLFGWAGNAHNAYLEVILATGLVGLFLLLVFIAYCAWLCLKWRNHALICILLFVCLESIFNPLLLSPRTPMLVLILLMLAASELPRPLARPRQAGIGLAWPPPAVSTVDRRSRPNEIVSLRLHSRKNTPTEQKESNARLATTSPVARRNKR